MQGPFKDETFEIRVYIHQMNLSDARTNFRKRSNMLNCKIKQRSHPVYACQNLDMQSDMHMPHSGRVLISTVTKMMSNISRKSSKSVRA